jgi:hypothetical protein
MTVLNRSFEGITSGTTITTSTNGTSDAPFTTVQIGAGATLTADNAHAAHGTIAMKLAPSSGAVTQVINSGLSSSTMAVRSYVYLTANPPGDEWIEAFYQSGGSTRVASWHIDSAGKINLRNAAAGNIWTATTAIPLNTWIRVEMYAAVGTTTSNGTLNIAYYTLDSTSAIASNTNTANTNTGTSPIDQVNTGHINGGTNITPFWIDDLRIDTATSGFIGPFGANSPPTANAGPTQTVAAGTLVTLAGSSSDADGFIASVAWSQLSGPTVSLSSTTINSPTFTPAVPGVIVLQYAATDNVGATTTSTVTINVNSTSARPVSNVSNSGGYTIVGGSSTLEAALADESDSTYIQSVAGPASTIYIAAVTPLASGTITVKHRSKQDISSPVITRVSELLQGPSNTSLASHSDNLTTTWTDYAWTLNTGQIAGITDLNSLRVRITDTQN